MRPLKILVCAAGSHGDVLPFIALSRELERRGHEPVLFASGHFERLAAEAGLPLVDVLPAAVHAALLGNPDATHPTRGMKLLSKVLADTLRPSFDRVLAAVEPGRTVLVGSSLALAARLVGEVARVPVATVHLAPVSIRSAHEIAAFGPFPARHGGPLWLNRAAHALADRVVLDPLFTAPFNAVRASLGLPPVHRLFDRWACAADLTIALYPPWFAPPMPDAAAGLRVLGFPLYDHAGYAALSPQAQAFLDRGEPPIAFTSGTANTTSQAFFATSIEACQRLGRRGVLITQDDRQLPTPLPPGLLHLRYVPFSALLPRVAAFVHHGGIGTTSQALRSGVPQLIRPMGYDQYDNAARAQRLGVAHRLPAWRYRPRAVTRALMRLLDDTALRDRARALAERMAREGSGIAAACDAVESLNPAPASPSDGPPRIADTSARAAT